MDGPRKFEPLLVQRVKFVWTKPLHGQTLGPNYSPDGIYVFATDYDHLLTLYQELKEKLNAR